MNREQLEGAIERGRRRYRKSPRPLQEEDAEQKALARERAPVVAQVRRDKRSERAANRKPFLAEVFLLHPLVRLLHSS